MAPAPPHACTGVRAPGDCTGAAEGASRALGSCRCAGRSAAARNARRRCRRSTSSALARARNSSAMSPVYHAAASAGESHDQSSERRGPEEHTADRQHASAGMGAPPPALEPVRAARENTDVWRPSSTLSMSPSERTHSSGRLRAELYPRPSPLGVTNNQRRNGLPLRENLVTHAPRCSCATSVERDAGDSDKHGCPSSSSKREQTSYRVVIGKRLGKGKEIRQ